MDEHMIRMLPGLHRDEVVFLKEMMRGQTERRKHQFLLFYCSKRREQQHLLVLALLGFIGVAGIHRMVTGRLLTGAFYLITFGFFGVGTLFDVLRIRRFSSRYNRRQAEESLRMTLAMAELKPR